MKKQSISLVLALVALIGVGGVAAPAVDPQASAPCCKGI